MLGEVSGVPRSACEREKRARVRVRVSQERRGGGAEEAAVKSGESGNITGESIRYDKIRRSGRMQSCERITLDEPLGVSSTSLSTVRRSSS